MRIALVSEGTYPFAVGGVSVWCDQLIRGLPEHRWEMVALTVDNSERTMWDKPENLDAVHRIPLWIPSPVGRRRPGEGFLSVHEAFLASFLTPLEARSSRAMVARSRFLLSLRGLYEYAVAGGNLSSALTSNAALDQMMAVWREVRHSDLTLDEALEAARLLEHMLRPLSAPAVKCDVIHSSMNGLCMLVAMTAKWQHGTPVVLSEHGIYLRERYLAYLNERAPHAVKTLMLSFFRSLAGAGYLISDTIAPHSAYNRRWQLHNGADPEIMWTMYNGVNPDNFPVATAEPERPTIVFMGRIDPLKDIHTLIRAFAHVRARLPQARLRIFGSTPVGGEAYGESCRQLATDLNLVNSVTFEGPVDSPVTAYHAGTVVALTSVSEGFPYSVIEAMACGRPLVCTNAGGVAEAVVGSGFVVPPRDYFGVAEACLKLLRDKDLRRQMAQAARARVLDMFTLAHSLEEYRRVYASMVTPVPQPRPAVEPVRNRRAQGRVQMALESP